MQEWLSAGCINSWRMPSCYSRKFQDSEMAFSLILSVFSFVATAKAECQIHDNYHIYYDITDLGVAALHNDVDAVDDLISEVGWLRYKN